MRTGSRTTRPTWPDPGQDGPARGRFDPPRADGAAAVYVRVVRFTDVDAERVTQLLARIEASDGPPPDVPSTGLEILVDAGQRTALVLQAFDTEADLRA